MRHEKGRVSPPPKKKGVFSLFLGKNTFLCAKKSLLPSAGDGGGYFNPPRCFLRGPFWETPCGKKKTPRAPLRKDPPPCGGCSRENNPRGRCIRGGATKRCVSPVLKDPPPQKGGIIRGVFYNPFGEETLGRGKNFFWPTGAPPLW